MAGRDINGSMRMAHNGTCIVVNTEQLRCETGFYEFLNGAYVGRAFLELAIGHFECAVIGSLVFDNLVRDGLFTRQSVPKSGA